MMKRNEESFVRPWKTSEGRLVRELEERLRMKGQENGIMKEKGEIIQLSEI